MSTMRTALEQLAKYRAFNKRAPQEVFGKSIFVLENGGFAKLGDEGRVHSSSRQGDY